MDTNTITTNGITFLETHQAKGCNAYCRDGCHAEIIWFVHGYDATERQRIAEFVFGLPIVALEPAPEAHRHGPCWYSWDGQGRFVPTDPAESRARDPYLFVFRTEEES